MSSDRSPGKKSRFRITILRTAIIALASFALVCANMGPASAATSTNVSRTSVTAPVTLSPNSAQIKLVPTATQPLNRVTVEVRDAAGRLVSTKSSSPGTALPQVNVGLGWSVYVYLNAGNINWLRGLGYTAATGTLCALLIETVIGAIACGVAAYIVYTIFYQPTVLPAGYCMEYKFSYAGTYQSRKLVKRSC